MKKILCPGAYTWKNKGDAALIICMLQELRRHYPDTEYTVMSDTPELDSKEYGEKVLDIPFNPYISHLTKRMSVSKILLNFYGKYIGWRFNIGFLRLDFLHSGPPKLFTPFIAAQIRFWRQSLFISFILRTFGEKSIFLLNKQYAEAYKAFYQADCAIFAPGGYLIAPHDKHLHWLKHLFSIFLAKNLRKPIVLFAVTTGPFEGRYNKWLAKFILNKVGLIVLREDASKNILKAIGVTRPLIVTTTDVAFLLEDNVSQKVRYLYSQYFSRNKIKIGVSVRQFEFPSQPDSLEKTKQYPQVLSDFLDYIIEVKDAEILLMPQVNAPECDDIYFSQLVKKLSKNQQNINILDEELTPQELKGLYGLMDVFVGVRMHANIFSLGKGLPVLAIAYEPKTTGIMEQLQLSEYVVDINNINLDDLKEKFENLIANRDKIRMHLQQIMPEIQLLAHETADYTAKYLNMETQ